MLLLGLSHAYVLWTSVKVDIDRPLECTTYIHPCYGCRMPELHFEILPVGELPRIVCSLNDQTLRASCPPPMPAAGLRVYSLSRLAPFTALRLQSASWRVAILAAHPELKDTYVQVRLAVPHYNMFGSK